MNVFAINCLVVLWFVVAVAGAILVIRKRKTWSWKIMLLILVFLLLLIARTAVIIYEPLDDKVYSGNLSWLEILASGFIHTLQSFSMDEDYTHYVIVGKQMVEELYGAGFARIYGVLISGLNVFAPIIGGAVLLDLLTGLFPWIKVYFHPKKRKIVFSDLNEKSITMAEDIVSQYYSILRPMIIFADTFEDNSLENNSKLFQRAKEINAILLKTPIYSLKLKKSSSVSYFLIDTDDYSNTSALSKLLISEEQLWPKGKEILNSRTKDVEQISDNSKDEKSEIYRTRIYYICHIEKTVEIANTIYNKSESKDQCLIRTINDYSHVAVNLMQDVPLFVPLLKQETKHDFHYHVDTDDMGRIGSLEPAQHLHVTLLGSGGMAEELFKAVFWCGQMYDIQLHLHILSQDAENLLRNLDSECPELFKSCKVSQIGEKHPQYESFDENLLRIYPHTDSPLHNPPYAYIDYKDNIDLENIREIPEEVINDTDYYIVVLGEDQKNFNVSKLLKRELSKRILDNRLSKCPVISVSIYDNDLADVISDENQWNQNPCIIPFGTFKSRFSCSNILFTKIFENAIETATRYDISEQELYFKDEYTYWANNARTIHAPYKLFALGKVQSPDSEHQKNAESYGVIKADKKGLDPSELTAYAWMEKRRWNAFLRSQGFCCATKNQHRNYYKELGSHKDLQRKLHNCLVERGFNQFPDLTDYPEDFSLFDALDIVIITANQMEKDNQKSYEDLKKENYKTYDDIHSDAYAQELLNMR